ncbi:MAG TPA: hypothetical protein VIY49_29200 [Bryobacteraceae bacterium]
MRTICLTMLFGALGSATTLQRLSLADMISKSTAIVHAKATGSYTAVRGGDIYTYYQFQVSQTFKPVGPAIQGLQVAVPGGAAQGIRQMVPGAPNISIGVDYVLFLWTSASSASGLTQIIGLSQGLFRMTSDPAGNAIIVRPASTEPMLDANGNAVTDQAMVFRWSDVLSQIQKAVGTGN